MNKCFGDEDPVGKSITMGDWLESFEYRIKMDPVIFVLAFLGALAIALLTVSIQAVNAALTNPAESLRYE